MKSTVSLAGIPERKRAGALEAATEELIQHLSERFPTSEGYAHKVEVYAAKWAWPAGAQSHEQALSMLSPEDRERAYRRNVRVTKGATWGLTVDVQTTDRAVSGGELMVLSESRLSVMLAVSGLVLGVLVAVAYWFTSDSESGRDLKTAFLIGLVLGLGLAGLGWVVSRPLEGIKPEQLKEISDSLNARLSKALSGKSKSAA
jgi:hypothetical protein